MTNHFLNITDDTVVNENHIQWVKKLENEIHVCMLKEGCKYEELKHSTIHNTIVCKKEDEPDNFKYLCQRFGLS